MKLSEIASCPIGAAILVGTWAAALGARAIGAGMQLVNLSPPSDRQSSTATKGGPSR